MSMTPFRHPCVKTFLYTSPQLHPYNHPVTTPPTSSREHLQPHPSPSHPISPHLPKVLLCILLRIIPRLLIEACTIILEFLGRVRLDRIVRDRLHKQLLCRQQDAHDLGAGLPGLRLEDADAHAAVLVKGDIWVPDAGLEGDLWGLEGVFGGEDEKEFEFSALGERGRWLA